MIGHDPALETLASLVQTHQADLLRVAVGLSGSGPLAREAADATWARVSGKLDALGRPSAARAILLHTVSAETLRRLRPGPVARLRTWLRPAAPAPTQPGGDERLASALSELSTGDRLLLALHHGAGRTSEEIAAHLDRSGAEVRAEVATLRERLVARLGVVDPYRPDADLTEVELDRRLGDRLVRLWDRAVGREEALATARRVLARRREHRRLPRPSRRMVLGGGAVGVLFLGVVGITALLPAGGTPNASPTPLPGSLVPLDGWSERVIADAPGSDYLVLGWAPDGQHVAVLDTNRDQVTVFDRDGHQVRSFPGTDAAWLGSSQLIVVKRADDWFPIQTLLARSIEAGPDLLVDRPGVDSIVGNAGAVAMTLGEWDDWGDVAQSPSFVMFRAGALTDPIPGVPLAWAPDGRTLAFVNPAHAYGSGQYGGPLHLLDAVTLEDRSIGADVNSDCRASFNAAATMLVACVPGPDNAYATDLALVSLADGSVQYSSLGRWARAVWAADSLVGIEASGAILRWRPGDMPVALRWQPERTTGITTIAAVGTGLALGQGDGPDAASMVAGDSPPLLLIPGPRVGRGGLASPDGTRLIYGRTLVPNGMELVMATLDAALASPPPTLTPPSQQPLEVGEAVLPTPSSAVVASLAGALVTARGPLFYTAYPSDGTFEDLRVTDVRYGSSVAIGLPVAAGEDIDWAESDGTYLAVMVSTPSEPIDWEQEDCPSAASRPLAWRLLAATLGPDGVPSGSFETIATGVARRVFDGGPEGCPFTMAPSVAIDGGVVAYAVEAPSRADRWASRIVLQRLSDGTAIRTVMTDDPVDAMWLSAGAVVWAEQPDVSAAPNGSWQLFVSTTESPARHAVEVPDAGARPDWVHVSLVGAQIVYQAEYNEGDAPSPVWRIPVNGGTPERLSPPDLPCNIGDYPSETVVLRCDTGGGYVPYLWTEDGALHPLDTTSWSVGASGGWMYFFGMDNGWSVTQVTAFPIGDLLR